MQVGQTYIITTNGRSARYLCIANTPIGIELKRVDLPKTKIDSVRRPANILIVASYKVFGDDTGLNRADDLMQRIKGHHKNKLI